MNFQMPPSWTPEHRPDRVLWWYIWGRLVIGGIPNALAAGAGAVCLAVGAGHTMLNALSLVVCGATAFFLVRDACRWLPAYRAAREVFRDE